MLPDLNAAVPPAPWDASAQLQQAQHLLNSFEHWLGSPLIPRTGSLLEDARALFLAPFVIVSHGTQADPILNYGNATALRLWEMDWATLTSTPSRYTAEPMHREERAALLDRTTRFGFVDDYRGIRISSQGKRFRIDRAIVWNLINSSGERIGQAATFSEWFFLPERPAN